MHKNHFGLLVLTARMQLQTTDVEVNRSIIRIVGAITYTRSN